MAGEEDVIPKPKDDNEEDLPDWFKILPETRPKKLSNTPGRGEEVAKKQPRLKHLADPKPTDTEKPKGTPNESPP